jgi:hypothetical protein
MIATGFDSPSATNNTNIRNTMWYAYENGKYVGSANILGRETLQAEHPSWEWLSEKEHGQRECLRDRQEMRVYDILQEMERSINEFNEYTEELFNG